jgi:hypothetical protein
MSGRIAGAVAYILVSFVQAREGREYKAWASCKPGSWVKARLEIDRGEATAVAETTATLLEVTKEKAVLEQTGTMTSKGKTVDMPKQKLEPGIKDVEAGKMLKQGDEDLEVDGKKLKCHWEETEVDENGLKSTYRVWRNATVPGGMVRTEIRSGGAPAASTRIVVLKWEKK